MKDADTTTGSGSRFLALFLAGDAPSSNRARHNLLRALEAMGMHYQMVREVDVLDSPEEAIRSGIFANPALVYRGADARAAIIYGDLSDQPQLRDFLDSVDLREGAGAGEASDAAAGQYAAGDPGQC
jgi:hypothetical protein